MLLRIIVRGKTLYRTVYRHNVRKVAKSIHKAYPLSDYATLHAMILNWIDKDIPQAALYDDRLDISKLKKGLKNESKPDEEDSKKVRS